MDRHRSRFWHRFYRISYWFLARMDPLIRPIWRLGLLGITIRLVVRGRRTGRERALLLGLLTVEGRWYVGHPNGQVAWTRNLAAAGAATVHRPTGDSIRVRAVLLGPGEERDAAILATSSQQPFPGSLLYRAARRHILAEGAYFRLEPMS
jgi:hypothetical protein